jgi:hypothetical protein
MRPTHGPRHHDLVRGAHSPLDAALTSLTSAVQELIAVAHRREPAGRLESSSGTER